MEIFQFIGSLTFKAMFFLPGNEFDGFKANLKDATPYCISAQNSKKILSFGHAQKSIGMKHGKKYTGSDHPRMSVNLINFMKANCNYDDAHTILKRGK